MQSTCWLWVLLTRKERYNNMKMPTPQNLVVMLVAAILTVFLLWTGTEMLKMQFSDDSDVIKPNAVEISR